MNQQTKRYTNGKIFTGETWMTEAYITVEGDRVQAVSEQGTASETIDLGGRTLAPAFIDIQLYGGNGLLFGEHPSVESVAATVAYSREGGAELILPTVATNSDEIVFAAIDAVQAYWDQGGTGVFGLHLEGPFLNPKRRGAHAIDKIQEPTLENIRKIIDRGRGVVKLMTIAPELFSDEGLQLLKDAGIILSAGHSDATYDQANAAFGKGVTLCTHLFNAMSPLQHRAPGLVGAILDHGTVLSSLVTDGYHVDPAAIRIAKKAMGERLFIITDAVTANAGGYYQHRLDGNRYVMPDGTLSGSALTMRKAVQFCVEKVGLNVGEALRMASLYPARALGIDHEWGRIAPSYRSGFAIL